MSLDPIEVHDTGWDWRRMFFCIRLYMGKISFHFNGALGSEHWLVSVCLNLLSGDHGKRLFRESPGHNNPPDLDQGYLEARFQ